MPVKSGEFILTNSKISDKMHKCIGSIIKEDLIPMRVRILSTMEVLDGSKERGTDLMIPAPKAAVELGEFTLTKIENPWPQLSSYPTLPWYVLPGTTHGFSLDGWKESGAIILESP